VGQPHWKSGYSNSFSEIKIEKLFLLNLLVLGRKRGVRQYYSAGTGFVLDAHDYEVLEKERKIHLFQEKERWEEETKSRGDYICRTVVVIK